MKPSCIKFFSFRPENHTEMKQYLEDMLKDGWRLKWCKSFFAGFERTENKNLRYIVDPYAVTSIANLKKFPKFRLNDYMENGWYAITKSKGCCILCTDDTEAEIPELESGMEKKIQNTCKIGSILLSILILALMIKAFTVSAIVYAVLLTDIYILLVGILGFLVVFNLINAVMILGNQSSDTNKPQGMSKRYILHDIGLLCFILIGILLQARQQPSMVIYLMLPIIVIILGTMIMIKMSRGTKSARDSNKKLIPIACVLGVALLVLIPFSLNRLKAGGMTDTNARQDLLLAQSDELPVMHLSDFFPNDAVEKAVKENASILGTNMLYAEETDELSVFTNYTVMKNTKYASRIFYYLYGQAQIDSQENFVEKEYNGITYYELEKASTYLLQQDKAVYFCTVPEGIENEKVLDKLVAYLSE